MRLALRIFIVAFCFIFSNQLSFAVVPDEVLKDAALETRARDISKDLRCLVCQNESIDDSSAPLAKDLRVLVRERLTLGDTDTQIFDYVVARYGNYVLLKPPFKADTFLLWAAPFIVMLIALAALFTTLRKSAPVDDEMGLEAKDDLS